MKKIWLATGSLSVITASVIAVTAVRGAAVEEAVADKKTCGAVGQHLANATTAAKAALENPLGELNVVTESVNALKAATASLVSLGCLPEPSLQFSTNLPAAPGGRQQPLPTLPVPSASALPVELPTVAVCLDLSAELTANVSAVIAALLSTDAPDVTAALEALATLTITLEALVDPANDCLPAPAPASR